MLNENEASHTLDEAQRQRVATRADVPNPSGGPCGHALASGAPVDRVSVRRWSVDENGPLMFRDEADWSSVAQGADAVVLVGGATTLAWSAWLPAALWFVQHGRLRVVGHSMRADLRAGDLLICEHGERVTAQTPPESRSTAVGILLAPRMLNEAARARFLWDIDESPVLPELVRDGGATALAARALTASVCGGDAQAAQHAKARHLTDELLLSQTAWRKRLDRCPGRTPRARMLLARRVASVLRHVESTVGNDSSIPRLAEVARMSPAYFVRVFSQVMSMTPHRHVLEVRLGAAKRLLEETDHSMLELCRRLGFENRCAFARMFKQFYGIAPTAQRRYVRGIGSLKSPAARSKRPVAAKPQEMQPIDRVRG